MRIIRHRSSPSQDRFVYIVDAEIIYFIRQLRLTWDDQLLASDTHIHKKDTITLPHPPLKVSGRCRHHHIDQIIGKSLEKVAP